MGDIKIFRYSSSAVSEIEGRSAVIEKSLQTLIERNLEAFLGVRFLASEYSIGNTHSGRIDTLGIRKGDRLLFPVRELLRDGSQIIKPFQSITREFHKHVLRHKIRR